MPNSGKPLGIGLAIDFAGLDKDLGKVADKIEQTGREAALKVGTLAGMAVKGNVSGDKLAEQVSHIGIQLSTGMASGVRTSSALMLSFGARINSMLDRLAGVAISLFTRIDSAMRFQRFDAFAARTQTWLTRFASGGKKTFGSLDAALAGGFGKIIQGIAATFNDLFTRLGKTITDAMALASAEIRVQMHNAAFDMQTSFKASLKSIAENMNSVAGKARSLEADVAGVMQVPAKTMAPSRFPAQAGRAGIGRQLGANILQPKSGPAAAAAAAMEVIGKIPQPKMLQEFLAILRQIPGAFAPVIAGGKQAVVAITPLAQFIGRTTALLGQSIVAGFRLGAAFSAIGVAGVRWMNSIHNTMTSLGSVSKKTYHELYEGNNLFVGGLLIAWKSVVHLTKGLWDIGTLKAFRRVGQDASSANTSIKASVGLVGKLIGPVTRLGVELAAAFGVIGVVYKIVEFFRSGTKAASELNAVTARSKVVFSAAFGTVEAQADKLTKSFSISKKAQLELAAGFGSMAQGAGLSETASAGLANQLTSLAVDMTAFGIPLEEVSDALKSGLSGRAISLREFGVQIDEDTTKAYAYAHGLARVGMELTNQQTIMSRVGLIMDNLGYAQGALAKTTGLASTQFQMAGGGVAVFGEKLGELLLPALQSLAVGFNTLMGAILDFVDKNSVAIKEWVDKVSNAFKFIGVVVRNWGDIWKIAQLEFGAFTTNVLAYINTIGPNFGVLLGWLGKNWKALFSDMFEIAKRTLTSIMANGANFAQALADGLRGKGWNFVWAELEDSFKATTEKFPELIKPALVNVDKEVADIWAKIFAKEAAIPAVAPPGGVSKKPPFIGDLAGTKKSKDEYKLGGAIEIGSKEAFSAISRNTAMSHNVSTTQLGVAKQSLATQKSILGALTGAPMGGLPPMLGEGVDLGQVGAGYQPRQSQAKRLARKKAVRSPVGQILNAPGEMEATHEYMAAHPKSEIDKKLAEMEAEISGGTGAFSPAMAPVKPSASVTAGTGLVEKFGGGAGLANWARKQEADAARARSGTGVGTGLAEKFGGAQGLADWSKKQEDEFYKKRKPESVSPLSRGGGGKPTDANKQQVTIQQMMLQALREMLSVAKTNKPTAAIEVR